MYSAHLCIVHSPKISGNFYFILFYFTTFCVWVKKCFVPLLSNSSAQDSYRNMTCMSADRQLSNNKVSCNICVWHSHIMKAFCQTVADTMWSWKQIELYSKFSKSYSYVLTNWFFRTSISHRACCISTKHVVDLLTQSSPMQYECFCSPAVWYTYRALNLKS